MLGQLICAHLVGDFLLQNDWMQKKSVSSWVCTAHVLCYAVPFWPLLVNGLPVEVYLAILAEHWLQDRFALHRSWMAFYGHSPVASWPVGPLCVDQAMHIGFIWIVSLWFGLT